MYTTKTVDSQTTSPWIPLDDNQAAFNVSVAVAVTGTLTYTVQFTLDNIQDPSVTPVAFAVSSLTGKTADASTSLRSSVKAVRLNVTSYTSGSATIGVRQGTSWDGVDFAASSGPVTLLQSGVPFWIPPGDAGANGLSFTGTAGQFTLSAAVVTNFWNLLATGGYAYIPAGAGGLATGGLYWCKMTNDTTGEIFAETYSGTGELQFVETPTALPNLSAGRITQSTNEITLASFTLPGGSMGPNGILNFTTSVFGDSSAVAKTHRVRGGGVTLAQFATSTNSCAEYLMQIKNRGTQLAQFGPRSVGVGSGGTTIGGTWQYAAIDTSVDKTIALSVQLSSNTGSAMLAGLFFYVQFGA